MKRSLLLILSIVLCFSFFSMPITTVKADNSLLPAFPGAEGFGYASKGGRGGEVYHVTSYELTGPGTFYDALMTAGDVPRTVVFDISGEITIPKTVVKNKANITIAGQTAPGDGVTIRGETIRFINSNDIVIRYLRFRPGSPENFNDDAMYIEDSPNVIIDHCSFSWGGDEVLSIKSKNYEDPKSKNITVQWTMMSEGLLTHSMGGLIEMNTITMHHNLYAHNNDRNPKTKGQMDFVNNIVYNWGQFAYVAGGESGTKGYGNVVGNYFIAGLNTKDPQYAIVRGNENYNVYMENNRIDSNKNGTLDGTDTGTDMIEKERPANVVSERYEYPLVHTQEPQEAYEYILDYAGASIFRDAVDERVINSVRDQTGTIIGHENDVGGYPALEKGTLLPDSDGDGMPDEWELANGLNPFDPEDRNGDMKGQGYTNLEYYLNELAEPGFPSDYPMSPPKWDGPVFTPPTEPTTDPDPVPETVKSMDGDILRNVMINDNSSKGIENAKKWTVEKNLQIGDIVAADRATGSNVYRFTTIPDEVLGSEWIRTAVESRGATSDDLISFYLAADADVYVAHDSRITSKPEWLKANYEDTGETMIDSQPVNFELYKKHYPAGSFVKMGPNNSTSRMNYFVMIKPTGSQGERPVNPPMDLVAEITSDDSIALNWSPVNEAETYLIYRSSMVDNNFKVIGSSKNKEYIDETFELGITYNYKVSAVNAGGESPQSLSAEVFPFDSTEPVPSAPKGLTVPVVKSTFTELDWDSVEKAVFYNVYRATELDGPYNKIASSFNPKYTDKTVTPSTTYYYKVSANGIGGKSKKSDSVEIKTTQAVNVPEVPRGLAAKKVATSSIEIDWDTVKDAETYNIYRKADGDDSFTLINETSSTTYIDQSIDTKKTGYTYVITAVNEMGESEPSEELSTTMPLPLAPSNLFVGLAGESFVGLIWQEGGGGSQYIIYREANGKVEQVGASKVNTFYDRTPEVGVEYTYYIKAENGAGESEKSNAVKIIPSVVSADSMKTLVELFEKEGEFKNKGSAQSLKMHLTAISLYEKREAKDKIVKHMQSFHQLINMQNENALISNSAYNILKHYAISMDKKWQ
ncbi:FIMAH domain-containing protein [Bacillus sp. FSL K6-3431]|uniref:FIMAH domain-containing protein n=1 Tax=Bacillus sp. FSL K6-3431 TaxID=2921500 RepID=UPI0030FBA3AA